MAEVMIAIKWTNRKQVRVYSVTGGTFEAMKNAVQATGAHFDGHYRRWDMPASKKALESLKARFTITSADIFVAYTGEVALRATNEMIWTPNISRSGMSAQEVAAKLQAALDKSDADFEAALNSL